MASPWVEEAKNAMFTGLDYMAMPGDYLRGALAGRAGDRLTGREMLENWGVLGANQEGLDVGDVAGFGVDLIVDPINLALGGAGILAGVGKAGVRGLKGLAGLARGGKAAETYQAAKSALGAIPAALKSTPALAASIGSPIGGAYLLSENEQGSDLQDLLGLGMIAAPFMLPAAMAAARKAKKPTVRDVIQDTNQEFNPPTSDKFKNFFGKSVTVSETGAPVPVWHGTPAESFEVFRPSEKDVGLHFGTKEQAQNRAMTLLGQTGKRVDESDMSLFPGYIRLENPARLSRDITGLERPSMTIDAMFREGVITADQRKSLLSRAEGIGEYAQPFHEEMAAIRKSVEDEINSGNVRIKFRERLSPIDRVSHKKILNAIVTDKDGNQILNDVNRYVDSNVGDTNFEKMKQHATNDIAVALARQKRNATVYRDIEAALKSNGYDGLVYPNAVEGAGESYAVFDPTQIKSAIGNSGEYSRTNPSVLSAVLPPAAGAAMLGMNDDNDPTMNAIGTALLLGGMGLPLAMAMKRAGGKKPTGWARQVAEFNAAEDAKIMQRIAEAKTPEEVTRLQGLLSTAGKQAPAAAPPSTISVRSNDLDATTEYTFDKRGRPIAASSRSSDGEVTVAKDESQALDWWHADERSARGPQRDEIRQFLSGYGGKSPKMPAPPSPQTLTQAIQSGQGEYRIFQLIDDAYERASLSEFKEWAESVGVPATGSKEAIRAKLRESLVKPAAAPTALPSTAPRAQYEADFLEQLGFWDANRKSEAFRAVRDAGIPDVRAPEAEAILRAMAPPGLAGMDDWAARVQQAMQTSESTRKYISKELLNEARAAMQAPQAAPVSEFTDEFIEAAGKTARPWKTTAVYSAAVPLVKPGMKVVDYGSGPYQTPRAAVEQAGGVYVPFDRFGNIGSLDDIADADIIMASNVLNVQSKAKNPRAAYDAILAEIKSKMKPDAVLVANMPTNGPRSDWMTPRQLFDDLKKLFTDVERHGEVMIARGKSLNEARAAMQAPQAAPDATVPDFPDAYLDDLGVRVRDKPLSKGLDAGIADELQAINDAGYTTIQSMSGLKSDYPSGARYSSDGYMSFLKSKNSPEQQQEIIEAATKAGLAVKPDSEIFFQPAVTVRSGMTVDRIPREVLRLQANEVANAKIGDYQTKVRGKGGDIFDRWLDVRDKELKKLIDEHGGMLEDDASIYNMWRKFTEFLTEKK